MPYGKGDREHVKKALGALLGLSDQAYDAKLNAKSQNAKGMEGDKLALDEMSGPEQIEDADGLGELSDKFSVKPLKSSSAGLDTPKPAPTSDGTLSDDEKRRLTEFYQSI